MSAAESVLHATPPLILVAEDNPDILRLVEGRLRRRGYAVITARDGRDALRLATERVPDLVVLDWLMPEIQGDEVCAQLKRETRTAAIPIVVLTARAAEADVVRGFESGADDYLTKPFEIGELVDAISRLLGRANSMRR